MLRWQMDAEARLTQLLGINAGLALGGNLVHM